MITCKKPQDIAIMRELGSKTAAIVSALIDYTKAGHSTKDIENFVNELMRKMDVSPAFLGCYGFPGSLCISVNEELIHGIPNKDKILVSGDIVSIDFGLKGSGYFSDMAYTFPVGEVDSLKSELMKVGKEALDVAIKTVRPNATVGDIGFAVQSYVESKGYCVVKKFVGHGIGTDLHEEPEIPNFGNKNEGPVLKEGMTLAIEPMITVDSDDVEIAADGWTVVAVDNKPCVHFEHTVVVTSDGVEILTV